MKKSEVRNGDILVKNSGEWGIVMNDDLMYKGEDIVLSKMANLCEDLTSNSKKSFDVKKVLRPKTWSDLLSTDLSDYDVIWERAERRFYSFKDALKMAADGIPMKLVTREFVEDLNWTTHIKLGALATSIEFSTTNLRGETFRDYITSYEKGLDKWEIEED